MATHVLIPIFLHLLDKLAALFPNPPIPAAIVRPGKALHASTDMAQSMAKMFTEAVQAHLSVVKATVADT